MYNPKDFKVKEVNEENFKHSIIERSNMVNEFTLGDIEASELQLQRAKTEMEAQKGLCEKTCENIARNHKEVSELSDELLHHAWMYQENKTVVDDATAKLVEIDEQLEHYKEMTDIIYEVGGFVKSDVIEEQDVPEGS